jgi:choline-sulfatase
MPSPVPSSGEGKPDWVRRRARAFSPDEVTVTRRQYCAAIAAIDDQVGRILDAVARRGAQDDTIVIYASDHGEMLGDHGLYNKSCPYEAAVRVPLMAAGPGIRTGAVSDTPVELNDVNATICDLAGLPPQEGIDARSFRAVLEGSADAHRTETVSAIRNFRLIRTHDAKLVEHANDRTELYDLKADPDEQHNIADREKDLARHLSRRMAARFGERKWMR